MRRASRVLTIAVLGIMTSTLMLTLMMPSSRGRALGGATGEPSPEADEPALTMSTAVACASIEGFEDYEVLPDSALTSDEKLLVYFRPLHYHVEASGATRHIHLIQDGQIRRRGGKAVLSSKLKLVDYEWKSTEPERTVFIRNTVSLKGLKPGEYDYDIILHDVLAPGAPTARQTLPFRVIPPGPRESKSGGG